MTDETDAKASPPKPHTTTAAVDTAKGREAVPPEQWVCPMRGKVLTCAGKPMKLRPPSEYILFSCTVWECPHTAKAQ